MSRADSFRDIPWASPAVIVIPDRLMPGIRAIAWAMPTTSASASVPSAMVRIPR